MKKKVSSKIWMKIQHISNPYNLKLYVHELRELPKHKQNYVSTIGFFF